MPARKPNRVVSVIDGEAVIDVSSKKFPSHSTRIDTAYLPIILNSPRRWYIAQGKNKYVVRNVGAKESQKTELLHRVILGIENDSIYGDHKDRDTLNNRRYNLRSATPGQNLQNQGGHRRSSSKYLGVSWCKRDKCWRAHFQIDGIHRALGSFRSEDDAALAYDNAVRHDPFANLNFTEAERPA